MNRLWSIVLFTALIPGFLIAQDQEDKENGTEVKKEKKEKTVWSPTFGLGAGVLTYFGDVSENIRTNRPSTSRPAFHFIFRQNLSDAFEFELNAWSGLLSANERTLERNRNFQSRLFGAGLRLNYNFDHLLSPDRILEPFVGVGFDYFEFNSKTDLQDGTGQRYHYWDDGTIRNMPQSLENRESAQRIQRNYNYETDLRELTRNELGYYDKFSFAVPVTAGLGMNVSKGWDMRFMATYYFTFTNYIDGVTEDLSGVNQGNSNYDNFLYLGVQATFNLNSQKSYDTKKIKEPEFLDDTPFDIDLYSDSDGDNVPDIRDECPNTPEGVQVDDVGCPKDSDGDGIPDYLDAEPASTPGVPVDSAGVELKGEALARFYEAYYDTTGKYSPIEQEVHVVNISTAKTRRKRGMRDKTYAVKIGEFDESIPNDLINQVLSLPEIETFEKDGKVILALGNFKDITSASEKRGELKMQGIDSEGIISRDKLGNVTDIGQFGSTSSDDPVTIPDRKREEGTITRLDPKAVETGEAELSREGIAVPKNRDVFRIQLGAFSKQPDMNKFKGATNLISFKSNDGMVRVYAGEYSNYSAAARAKIDYVQKGYSGAYIVAMRGGNKIDVARAKEVESIEIPDRKLEQEEKSNLKFRIQLGSYSTDVPTSALERFMELPDVDQKYSPDGYTKVVAGSFDTYEEADKFKKELRNRGFEGAFVVGEYNGRIFSAKKAIELAR